jgi:hypothetical protein
MNLLKANINKYLNKKDKNKKKKIYTRNILNGLIAGFE